MDMTMVRHGMMHSSRRLRPSRVGWRIGSAAVPLTSDSFCIRLMCGMQLTVSTRTISLALDKTIGRWHRYSHTVAWKCNQQIGAGDGQAGISRADGPLAGGDVRRADPAAAAPRLRHAARDPGRERAGCRAG